MSILRRDPITGESVVFAVDRSQRPSDLKINEKLSQQTGEATTNKDFNCPFCPGNEETTPPEISSRRKGDHWQTRTFENKFPIFKMATGSEGGEAEAGRQQRSEFGASSQSSLLQETPEQGAHLVVVEHPHHNHTFFQLTPAEMQEILLTYQEAYEWVANLPEVAYILTFKNYQRKAGASLHHPHSQVLGTSFVPWRLARELAGVEAHREQTGNCIFCDLLAEEMEGERQIKLTDNYLILAPYGSRLSYETWILPRQHQAQFTDVSRDELTELAELLVSHFQNLYQVLGDFPFNMVLHVGPTQGDDFHWHIEILPRISSMAGFELGGGMQVNSVLPESVAHLLRQGGEVE